MRLVEKLESCLSGAAPMHLMIDSQRVLTALINIIITNRKQIKKSIFCLKKSLYILSCVVTIDSIKPSMKVKNLTYFICSSSVHQSCKNLFLKEFHNEEGGAVAVANWQVMEEAGESLGVAQHWCFFIFYFSFYFI